MNSLVLCILALSLLLLSFIKDKTKTKKSLMKAYKSFTKLLPFLLPMILFIGISLSILNPTIINRLIGSGSGIAGISLAMILGSVTFMPSFVAFPLGANLLAHGAGYPQIAGFISTLMAVGFVSLPVEIKYFDKRTAIMRNTLGLIASIIFVIIIWSVMN